MNSELNSYKSGLGIKWVKNDAGTTYLCPVGAIEDSRNLSDKELQSLCIEESLNPQND